MKKENKKISRKPYKNFNFFWCWKCKKMIYPWQKKIMIKVKLNDKTIKNIAHAYHY